jgi:hypothetical protein
LFLSVFMATRGHKQITHQLHRRQVMKILRIAAHEGVELPPRVADLPLAAESQLSGTIGFVELNVLLDVLAAD